MTTVESWSVIENPRMACESGVRGIVWRGSRQDDQRTLCKRRVAVEGSISALKSGRYAFNRPKVRSTAMMLAVGQRAILGYNLNRLLQRTAAREAFQLVGA